jgi:hypothetical protein
MTDLRDLEKGMELARKELNNRMKDKSKPPQGLQDFVTKGSDVVQRLKQKGEAAQVHCNSNQTFLPKSTHIKFTMSLSLRLRVVVQFSLGT